MPLPPTRADALTGNALSVVDYRSVSQSTDPADAAGVIVATFDPVPPGLIWLVERMTVTTTSAPPTIAMVYAGAASSSNLVDGSSSGNLDTADEASPILIESNTSLTVVWTGAAAGAVGTCRVQYQLVQRG